MLRADLLVQDGDAVRRLLVMTSFRQPSYAGVVSVPNVLLILWLIFNNRTDWHVFNPSFDLRQLLLRLQLKLTLPCRSTVRAVLRLLCLRRSLSPVGRGARART